MTGRMEATEASPRGSGRVLIGRIYVGVAVTVVVASLACVAPTAALATDETPPSVRMSGNLAWAAGGPVSGEPYSLLVEVNDPERGATPTGAASAAIEVDGVEVLPQPSRALRIQIA